MKSPWMHTLIQAYQAARVCLGLLYQDHITLAIDSPHWHIPSLWHLTYLPMVTPCNSVKAATAFFDVPESSWYMPCLQPVFILSCQRSLHLELSDSSHLNILSKTVFHSKPKVNLVQSTLSVGLSQFHLALLNYVRRALDQITSTVVLTLACTRPIWSDWRGMSCIIKWGQTTDPLWCNAIQPPVAHVVDVCLKFTCFSGFSSSVSKWCACNICKCLDMNPICRTFAEVLNRDFT